MTTKQIELALTLKGHSFVRPSLPWHLNLGKDIYIHDCPGDTDIEDPSNGISCNHCPFQPSESKCLLNNQDALTHDQSRWLEDTYPELFI